MSAVTWNSLAKTINDSQTIAEYIAAQFATHNADDSAHGQSNEALYNHRIAEILDHVDQSITNAKILASHRTYSAVVGSDAEDDFDNIQDAIDFVNGLGGGTIFIKPGTYSQGADLVLYSNVQIESNDPNSVIIDFQDAAYGVQIVGSAGTHKENISLKNLTFTGSDSSNDGVLDIQYADDIRIINCNFVGEYLLVDNGTQDIYLDNSTRIYIQNNYFADSRSCISAGTLTDFFFQENYVESCNLNLIEVFGVGDKFTISGNYIAQSGGFFYSEYGINHLFIDSNYGYFDTVNMIYLEQASFSSITNNRLYGNDQNYNGITLVSSDRCIVTGNYIYNVNLNGIFIDSDSDRCVISNNIVNSCDAYGIKINNSNCNNNILLGNVVSNNTSGGISDSGTGTVSDDNVST